MSKEKETHLNLLSWSTDKFNFKLGTSNIKDRYRLSDEEIYVVVSQTNDFLPGDMLPSCQNISENKHNLGNVFCLVTQTACFCCQVNVLNTKLLQNSTQYA